MIRLRATICYVAFFHLLASGRSIAQDQPVFDIDVMAVLSKAGCNAGACHGSQNGKGGLRLSLRGEDPDWDYQALVKDEGARRVNPIHPDASLLLRKPMMHVSHEGGLRFTNKSLEYRILFDWLSEGVPRRPAPRAVALSVEPSETVYGSEVTQLQLSVRVHFADGSMRDVTPLAVYEVTQGPIALTPSGLVQRLGSGEATLVVRFLNMQTSKRLAFLGQASDEATDTESRVYTETNYIDRWINAKLALFGVPPSPPCDDATFVRRVSLDLLGVLPSVGEAREFCEDRRPDKRAALVDRLLARPEFAEHWALKWSDLLRVEEKTLDTRGVDVFYTWLRDALANDKPLDELIRELVTARGSTYEVPPANFYRAHRDPFIRAETVARLFLGIRLQCARCHNHPYDQWTQNDYYSWASCFDGIEYEVLQNERRDKFDMHEFVGEQIVKVKSHGSVKNPRTGEEAPAKLLEGASVLDTSGEDRLTVVANWLTDVRNPRFSRVVANWVFYHLMGRGLVEPLDDFRITNPPSHPELLDALAADLVENQFRLKPLVRRIVLSQAYQRSAHRLPDQDEEDRLFARAVVRRLTAEQVLDIVAQALDIPLDLAGYPRGTRAGQIRGVRRVREREQRPTADDRFLRSFGKPERLLACECERNNDLSLKQVFSLVGEDLQQRLRSSPKLTRLAEEPDQMAALAELFWGVLCRPPTEAERQECVELLASAADRRAAWEDIAWALINSRESLFRH